MMPKNTICLWFDKDAVEAARFYATTFPDSEVTAVHEAPRRLPGWRGGKACLRSDDADEENRHRHHRGSPAGLTGVHAVSRSLRLGENCKSSSPCHSPRRKLKNLQG